MAETPRRALRRPRALAGVAEWHDAVWRLVRELNGPEVQHALDLVSRPLFGAGIVPMVSVIVIARRCNAAFEWKEKPRLDNVQDPSWGVSGPPLVDERLQAARDTLSELSFTGGRRRDELVRERNPLVRGRSPRGWRGHPGVGRDRLGVKNRREGSA